MTWWSHGSSKSSEGDWRRRARRRRVAGRSVTVRKRKRPADSIRGKVGIGKGVVTRRDRGLKKHS